MLRMCKEKIKLHCYLSDKVIVYDISFLSQLCYVCIEVNTHELRPYVLSCCVTSSRGCNFFYSFVSKAALSYMKSQTTGTFCGRWHAEGSDK
jgi:hypothetical protein